MSNRNIARAAGIRMMVAAALVVSLAALTFASSALAKEPTGEFAVFKQCPRSTTGVNLCLYSQTLSGEVTINKQTVPIEKTITLQGGIELNEETGAEKFVGALNGETLSKTPQKVPGGLLGLVKCNEITGSGFLEVSARIACELTFENILTGVNAVTELARPASEIQINTSNLENREGTALGLPVKVRLENPFLGGECYIGSSSSPVRLNLTTGTTSPNKPNEPIHGKVGTIHAKHEFELIEITNNTLVNNEFAAPEASGCGGIFSFLIDPLIDAKLGIPSPDGENTAIQNNTIREATTTAVIASE
jgi:hypothetical protein